jgi:aspartate/glutamate racemase
MNMKNVAAIHTASPMVEPTQRLFAELLPDVRLFNVADDSLIQDVIRDGKVTERTARRLVGHFFSAVDAGADLIFNTCSSVGEIADLARQLISVPIVQIDEAMTAQAVNRSGRIGVLATLPTTLGPTVRLLKKQANKTGKDVEIVEGLAEGAFAAVIAGDSAKHDALILETAQQVAERVELMILAQGSMARMEKTLTDRIGKPVMSSPVPGVLAVKETLAQMP